MPLSTLAIIKFTIHITIPPLGIADYFMNHATLGTDKEPL